MSKFSKVKPLYRLHLTHQAGCLAAALGALYPPELDSLWPFPDVTLSANGVPDALHGLSRLETLSITVQTGPCNEHIPP
ncbi:hypothetical protein K470DRAFT_255610 [Piedraia hortae CBS 480.64]|uniref:Uncharacterized protein n=1 Tax=Piedraia hortae CBS 480.64 TaxID=1314780 RepID=A0A6A7C6R9_9PEZI|nr:hypothetical protein K470DRAFT_255610 [Piedraia hortae CBS 480.64]